MHFKFRNINTAFHHLVQGVNCGSIPTRLSPSRVGQVMVIDEPVIISYLNPMERVLFNPARDCNPFFHVFEALWMLAGRNDVAPLKYYNSRMGEFSDDGETFNGAYGWRWKTAAVYDDSPCCDLGHTHESAGWGEVDQLEIIVDHLRRNPDSRRVVLQMWTASDDLVKIDTSLDVCCNTCVYFLIRDGQLDMTVCNRSNDLIWGALGANVVHFSFLQEYMAACIGVGVGVYNQFSNNLHVYKDRWEPAKWLAKPVQQNYPKTFPMVKGPEVFNHEVIGFVETHSNEGGIDAGDFKEPFLQQVAQPMMIAFHCHKQKDDHGAFMALGDMEGDDWRIASEEWIRRRLK